jgi:HTH-type transcriptional regulator/antitoxin HigA
MRDDSAWPIDSDKRFDPIDVLHYAIEELGTHRPSLLNCWARVRVLPKFSLAGALTVDMIHKLSEAWKIPADLLVRPYRVDSRLR